MALITEAELNKRAADAMGLVKKSARQLVIEESALAADKKFDVFLSHSSGEPEKLLLGVIELFKEHGLSVYVDRYDDPQLTPDSVSPETAAILRTRMKACKSLLYIHSQHSGKSRWMPWELGFFDALKGKIGILPVVNASSQEYKGEEYLGLYPYVDEAPLKGAEKTALWINESPSRYCRLAPWIKGEAKMSDHT